jgi:hypothetical protein
MISAALDSVPVQYKSDLTSARGPIGNFVEILSCLHGGFGAGLPLNVYMSPDAGSVNDIIQPMMPMHYHDRNQCVDVVRFQGWTRLAANAYQFQVVYLASDSKESWIDHHTIVRQSDGAWLFKE